MWSIDTSASTEKMAERLTEMIDYPTLYVSRFNEMTAESPLDNTKYEFTYSKSVFYIYKMTKNSYINRFFEDYDNILVYNSIYVSRGE